MLDKQNTGSRPPDNQSTVLNIRKKDKASLSNILNEMIYEKKMTLQELRLFLLYLAKIDPKNPDQTEVTFSLKEYSSLLGVELNESAITAVMDKLLKRLVSIKPAVMPDYAVDGRIRCQLFSKCFMYKAKSDGKWYMSFKCHDDIKPYLFDFKGNFTEFEFWNAINLHSFHEIRLYMILKQYYRIGERVIELNDLKRMLGISINEFPEYKIFARSVLKKCQKALLENSDISFDFKPVGRPAAAVRFTIYENESYVLPKIFSDRVVAEVNDPREATKTSSVEHPYQKYYHHAIPSWPNQSVQDEYTKLLFKINHDAFYEEFDLPTMEYLMAIIIKWNPIPELSDHVSVNTYIAAVSKELHISYLQMSKSADSPFMSARSNYLAKIILHQCAEKLGFTYDSASKKYKYNHSHDNRFGFEHRSYDFDELEKIFTM